MVAYFGRPIDRAATIATRAAPRPAATAEALPPPGTGAAEASSRDEPIERQVAETSRGTERSPPADCTGGALRPVARRSTPASAVRVRRSRGGRGTGAPAPNRDDVASGVGGRRRPGRRAETPVPARRCGGSPVRRRVRTPLVEAGDRPAPRAVLEGQREARSRRVDLEEGPRPADHRIGRGLLADDRETGDRESLVAPRDLARTTVEPVGADLDLRPARHG